MSDITTTLHDAARRAWRGIRWTARKVHEAAVWTFAPVATSVKGALNSTDMRPILTKVVVLSSAAGASFRQVASEALKDPELAGAAVVITVALITGFLEALTRHQAGEHPQPAPSDQPPASPPQQ